jgi:hypothetical protein
MVVESLIRKLKLDDSRNTCTALRGRHLELIKKK